MPTTARSCLAMGAALAAAGAIVATPITTPQLLARTTNLNSDFVAAIDGCAQDGAGTLCRRPTWMSSPLPSESTSDSPYISDTPPANLIVALVNTPFIVDPALGEGSLRRVSGHNGDLGVQPAYEGVSLTQPAEIRSGWARPCNTAPDGRSTATHTSSAPTLPTC